MKPLRSREKKIACLASPSAWKVDWADVWKAWKKKPKKYSLSAWGVIARSAASEVKSPVSAGAHSPVCRIRWHHLHRPLATSLC